DSKELLLSVHRIRVRRLVTSEVLAVDGVFVSGHNLKDDGISTATGESMSSRTEGRLYRTGELNDFAEDSEIGRSSSFHRIVVQEFKDGVPALSMRTLKHNSLVRVLSTYEQLICYNNAFRQDWRPSLEKTAHNKPIGLVCKEVRNTFTKDQAVYTIYQTTRES
ncbi:4207_t:CDS:2, partial [Paraglomus occultum]